MFQCGVRCVVATVLLSAWLGTARAVEPTMVLRLKDGSYTAGQLRGAPTADHVGWQSEGFDQPFEFDARAVRSIVRLGHSHDGPGGAALADREGISLAASPHTVALAAGGALVGRVSAMDDRFLTVRSELFGLI